MDLSIMFDVIPDEESAFSVLAWVIGVIIPAMTYAIVKLWNKVEKLQEEAKLADDQWKLIMKEKEDKWAEAIEVERNYIKNEGKEWVKMLHSLGQAFGEVSVGVKDNIPQHIAETRDQLIQRIESFKFKQDAS